MPYDVTYQRLPLFTLFDLKGQLEELSIWDKTLPDFPVAPNSLSRRGNTELCFVGPNQWVLRAPVADEDVWKQRLKPETAPPEISIVRISDTLTFFRITGPDAAQVLSIGCPLDLHPDSFGPNNVSYTEFFGCKALVMRCDQGFDCAVEQSFGDMIEDYLNRANA